MCTYPSNYTVTWNCHSQRSVVGRGRARWRGGWTDWWVWRVCRMSAGLSVRRRSTRRRSEAGSSKTPAHRQTTPLRVTSPHAPLHPRFTYTWYSEDKGTKGRMGWPPLQAQLRCTKSLPTHLRGQYVNQSIIIFYNSPALFHSRLKIYSFLAPVRLWSVCL